MSSSYKIAMVAAFIICAGIIFYYKTEREPASRGQVQALLDQAGNEQRSEPSPTPITQPPGAQVAAQPSATTPSPIAAAPTPLQTPDPSVQTQPPTLTLDGSVRITPQAVRQQLPPSALPIPATTPTPELTGRDEFYLVRSGDTLSSIAVTVYGSERYWVDIAQANPLVDPIRLKVGQRLRMPDMTSGKDPLARTIQPPSVSTGAVTYVVRSGDSLYSIAKQYYGVPELWRLIYAVNRKTIGPDPGHLVAGMSLRIPPAPQSAR